MAPRARVFKRQGGRRRAPRLRRARGGEDDVWDPTYMGPDVSGIMPWAGADDVTAASGGEAERGSTWAGPLGIATA